MRKAPLLAVLFLAACISAPAPKPSVAVAPAPAALQTVQEPPEVQDPNFILVVTESVPNPADDGVSFTKVFVDGQEAGKTGVGRKSEERALKLKLPAGNQPLRLEHWTLPPVGEWTRLDDALQPRERFVRIEPATIARLLLRFSEGAASNTLTLSRENAPR
ncbi:MAG: hypothetical protein AAB262_14205 [Elusimicrobiota bacterium]